MGLIVLVITKAIGNALTMVPKVLYFEWHLIPQDKKGRMRTLLPSLTAQQYRYIKFVTFIKLINS